MPKIKLQAYNYYPDFNNENLIKKGVDIVNGINWKNIAGFENFGFHELALNFSSQNIHEITQLAQQLSDLNIENIVIFSDLEVEQNFKAGYHFVLENDLLQNNKINYFFINSDNPTHTWFDQLANLASHIDLNKTAYIFAKLSLYTQSFIEFIKIFVNFVQQKIGYYRCLNQMFIVAKEACEEQLLFLEIDEENKLIIPNILHQKYSFFSEINLLLLFVKGIDISQVLDGYTSASIDFASDRIKDNLAFQYGYICSMLSQDKNSALQIGSDDLLKGILALHSRFKNEHYFPQQKWSSFTIFPQEIYTYAPYTIGMSNTYYASFFEVNKLRHDYRITPELNINDGVEKYKQNRLSEFTLINNEGIVTTLSSVANVPLIRITLDSNNEAVLGALICFLYWSNIFECYIKQLNPFKN
ncbi:hypothetical protein [Mycoplasma simbae]|uniref:hypothetical protein n=1 Tax=Mycoplasma simbae TaxID=36744 RepID=UPI000496A105|nr:hypothetical protein [Mycoplasma simbae]